MKILIPNYTFNAASQQITFGGYSNILLSSLLIITNATANKIIYNFADPTAGGTVSQNVLTLVYNTTAMNNTDQLLIYYDDGTTPARDASIQLLENQNDLLRRMVKLLESQGTVDSNNRQRIAIETVPGTTPVASALSAQNGNSYPASVNPYTLAFQAALVITEFPIGQEWRMADQARATFGVGIRANIK